MQYIRSPRTNHLRSTRVYNLLSERIDAMIEVWSKKWEIPVGAVADLRRILGAVNTDPIRSHNLTDETDVQNAARLRASQRGDRLWRNNSGAFRDERGQYVRFGLCNDSAQLNRTIKSADLIGIHPVVITTDMIGATIGQFMAIECKRPNWKYTGTARERAQLKFLELVISLGGIAYFDRGDTI